MTNNISVQEYARQILREPTPDNPMLFELAASYIALYEERKEHEKDLTELVEHAIRVYNSRW